MTEGQIRFDDGALYERTMGNWSRVVGDILLDWLRPQPGMQWIDVGCGNGAFSESIVERCAPASILGVDPSEGQLAFARTRPAARLVKFTQGDAMALPERDNSVDIAVMALVLFFVPDPAKGVAEMCRVVRPGGIVTAYVWDVPGGGFPHEVIHQEMRAMGVTPMYPPRADISSMGPLRSLWTAAGLTDVEARDISASRTFANFEEFWSANLMANIRPMIAAMPDADAERLKVGVRKRVAADATGRITVQARANAVKGRKTKS